MFRDKLNYKIHKIMRKRRKKLIYYIIIYYLLLNVGIKQYKNNLKIET